MLYLVMDLCTGGDLFDLIKQAWDKNTVVPEPTLARFATEMLDGIKYCHHHKFCHRDIKPENYMLKSLEAPTLQLIDFGLACECSEDTLMHLECGTPCHMAPEVIGRSYTQKCDIW